MRILELNNLLGKDEPDATFHDAIVESIFFDAISLSVKFEMHIPIRYEAGKPQYKIGILVFEQVHLFAMEPQSPLFESDRVPGLWLTSDGAVDTLSTDKLSIPALTEPLPNDSFFHYLYFSDTNSFAFVAASMASFSWSFGGHVNAV